VLHQHFGILYLRALHYLAIYHYVQVLAGLVFYGINHPGVAMAYVADTYAAYQVKVGFAICAIQVIALSPYDLYAYGCR
jgi:hypothetical protein